MVNDKEQIQKFLYFLENNFEFYKDNYIAEEAVTKKVGPMVETTVFVEKAQYETLEDAIDHWVICAEKNIGCMIRRKRDNRIGYMICDSNRVIVNWGNEDSASVDEIESVSIERLKNKNILERNF